MDDKFPRFPRIEQIFRRVKSLSRNENETEEQGERRRIYSFFFILSFLLVTAIFNNSRTFDNVGALFETEIRKFETLVELNPTYG